MERLVPTQGTRHVISSGGATAETARAVRAHVLLFQRHVQALAVGLGAGAHAPAALAAALPSALLLQSFAFVQGTVPSCAWALLRQRAVAEAYLHSMLPTFGDAARVAASTLAANAWPLAGGTAAGGGGGGERERGK